MNWNAVTYKPGIRYWNNTRGMELEQIGSHPPFLHACGSMFSLAEAQDLLADLQQMVGIAECWHAEGPKWQIGAAEYAAANISSDE